MPRLRTLKPEFFTHEGLGELPPLARLLFQGLWCYADRAGRLEDRPRYFKTVILPYDDCDTEALLRLLERARFIVRYEAEGLRLIAIPNFAKHQQPHVKEKASTLPEPPRTVPAPGQHGAQPVPAPGNHPASTPVFGLGGIGLGSCLGGGAQDKLAQPPVPSSAVPKGQATGPPEDAPPLVDLLTDAWKTKRGSAYAYDRRRDDAAISKALSLAKGDAAEVLRRWLIALDARFPRATCLSDMAKHWNAYAQAEGPAPPPRGRDAKALQPLSRDFVGGPVESL